MLPMRSKRTELSAQPTEAISNYRLLGTGQWAIALNLWTALEATAFLLNQRPSASLPAVNLPHFRYNLSSGAAEITQDGEHSAIADVTYCEALPLIG